MNVLTWVPKRELHCIKKADKVCFLKSMVKPVTWKLSFFGEFVVFNQVDITIKRLRFGQICLTTNINTYEAISVVFIGGVQLEFVSVSWVVSRDGSKDDQTRPYAYYRLVV